MTGGIVGHTPGRRLDDRDYPVWERAAGWAGTDAGPLDAGGYPAPADCSSGRAAAGGAGAKVNLRRNSTCSSARTSTAWIAVETTERYHTARISKPARLESRKAGSANRRRRKEEQARGGRVCPIHRKMLELVKISPNARKM